MTKRRGDLATTSTLKVSTPSDVICAASQLLGFTPRESLVIVCLHGARRRLGLVMRFDLVDTADVGRFVRSARERIRHERASGIFVLVYTEAPIVAGDLPREALVRGFRLPLGHLVVGAFLVSPTRCWSYLCDDSCCGGTDGVAIDPRSPGATSLAAAYALVGQGALADREAVVRSVALDLDPAAVAASRELIAASVARLASLSRPQRQRSITDLIDRILAEAADPRVRSADADLAEFVALAQDVVVRDEILVRAVDPTARELLIPVLRDMARRTPAPYDAPVCSMLAWIAYANGDGVIANVAIDRALATDPEYSLALLIADSLQRQVPPRLLEEVMRGAERDLHSRNAAG